MHLLLDNLRLFIHVEETLKGPTASKILGGLKTALNALLYLHTDSLAEDGSLMGLRCLSTSSV